MSTLRGIVYDMNGLPVPDQKFNLDYPFTTNEVGYYSTSLFSRIMIRDTICYEKWPGNFIAVAMTLISYFSFPGQVITRDIHLTDSLLTGISPKPQKNLVKSDHHSKPGDGSDHPVVQCRTHRGLTGPSDSNHQCDGRKSP